MTFFDVLAFSAALCAALLFGRYGALHFGLMGAIAGAALGLVAGGVLGRLPFALAGHRLKGELARTSSEDLRSRLRSGKEYFLSHLLLAELMSRGEDISAELDPLVAQWQRGSPDTRRFVLAAIRLGFPAEAEKYTNVPAATAK